MSATYLIEVTEEQLCGLRRAANSMELDLHRQIPQLEETVHALAARKDERFLAMARENLATARKWLAVIRNAVPALYGSNMRSGHNGSPSPRAALRPSTEHEAATASDLPLGGDSGASPLFVCTDRGALEAAALVSRESF